MTQTALGLYLLFWTILVPYLLKKESRELKFEPMEYIIGSVIGFCLGTMSLICFGLIGALIMGAL